jgi:hypothetical protein
MAPAPGVEPSGKPRGFSAIVILTIILSAVGILVALGGVASAILSEQMMSGPFGFGGTPAGAPPEMARTFEDMQRKMRELSMPWLTGPLAALQLAVSGWALFAALRMQKRRRGSAGPFSIAMAAFGVVEIVSLVVGLYLQVKAMDVVQEMMERMRLGSTPGTPPNFDEMMRTTMQVSIIVAIAFAIGWGAAKIIFCFYARHYAKKPDVRAWVDSG